MFKLKVQIGKQIKQITGINIHNPKYRKNDAWNHILLIFCSYLLIKKDFVQESF